MGIESIGIVLALEQAFGVAFPDRIARQARTVGDLEAMVLRLRAEQLPPDAVSAVPDAEVRALVRGVVARELNLGEEFVAPEADLVRDLGMDA